jgi:hypothetical protein
MIASSVQGFAANVGTPQINGITIKAIPKRDHGIVEHGIVEHCTDSARDCQLVAVPSQISRCSRAAKNVRQLCSVGLRRIVAETRGFLGETKRPQVFPQPRGSPALEDGVPS